jgi:hypothetical protein
LSSALCSTQGWALDADGAAATPDAGAPLSPSAQTYYEQWQNIAFHNFFLISKQVSEADPAQGPHIASALIRFFPQVVEKNPPYLNIIVHDARMADPKQSPVIVRALIALLPKIVKKDFEWRDRISDIALDIFNALSPQQKRAFYNQSHREIEDFLNWAPAFGHIAGVQSLYDELKSLYDLAQRNEAQAVAMEILSAERGGPLPPDVAGVVGEYIGGRDPRQHKSLKDIREIEEHRAKLQSDATSVMQSQRYMMCYEDQTLGRLHRYHAEESAFLAKYPGGDFKAAFAAKYPHMKNWLNDMIAKGHIR